MATDRSNAMDHMVVVLFENRSLDNVLGHLYGPEDGKTFEGVIGKDLSNPIPEWAEDGADRKVVPYTVATDMDIPNPDSGEEHPHTNTQLYNILNEHNRFKIQDAIGPPYNAPAPGQTPTMDGFVTDYISNFTGELGRQPTYEEYAKIMTGYTPEQVPVLNGLARGFGVFDHWFCEVPSQTLPNRSFWTSATSRGYVWNPPTSKFIKNSNSETIFNRLDDHGKTWKIYVSEPMAISWHVLIHYEALKDRCATHVVPFAQFETDAANGELPELLVHRTEHDHRPQRLPPRLRSVLQCQRGLARRRPPGVDPGWRRVPLTDLHRLPGDAGRDGLHRVEHDAARSAGTSRAAPTTTSRRLRCRARMRRPRPASSASRSTAPATEPPRSSSPRGSPTAR